METMNKANMSDVWLSFQKAPLFDRIQAIKEVNKALDTLKELSADRNIRHAYKLHLHAEIVRLSQITAAKKRRKIGKN